MRHTKIALALMALALLLPVGGKARAEGAAPLTDGQLIYVPAYSHIYSGDKEKPFLLTVTLSIRNIDPARTIEVTGVEYYQSQGRLLKSFLTSPAAIKPLGSLRYVIAERDDTGGSGANFMVKWRADRPANPPSSRPS